MSLMNIDVLAPSGFVLVAVLLLVYTWRYWAKRRKHLRELMPKLGLTEVEDPVASNLVPDLLFHPNGFPPEVDSRGTYWEEIFPRVSSAWSGRLGEHGVVIMDVTARRIEKGKGLNRTESRSEVQFRSTVVRYEPQGRTPPDFLVDERVWFKDRAKDFVPLVGNDTIGEHYFLFSHASEEELVRWLTPRARDFLSRNRLWEIAAHGGVLFLSYCSRITPANRFERFVEEAGELLSCMLDRGETS